MTSDELAAAIIEPHFSARRSVFARFSPEPGLTLERVGKVRLIITDEVHDTERHHAATRDDGREVLFSPTAADLGIDTLNAMIDHELGHVADFAYPGRWALIAPEKPAVWVPDEELHGPADTRSRKARNKLFSRWEHRNDDEVEWTADAIAWLATGRRIRYCGKDVRCMLQCFRGGIAPRPEGLR